ncbi:MAG: NADH-quinone oxidoreductase subunit NuoH [Chloroflexi bacterium]|nr:NADH-quinone oxidoreductase subunit NuoH [Chloroflexota bacterium]
MDWLHWIAFALLIVVFVFGMVMVFIWLERRGVGRLQMRPGPNRAGPFGLLQPVADAIKILLKEDIVPERGDRLLHTLAPIVAFAPALMVFAVVPFWRGEGAGLVPDMNIGLVYLVAISSISIVGVFMAGWASNNKYSLIGAMRMMAQMVSYEVPLVLALVGVALAAGSLSLVNIVEAQGLPFILVQPLGFLVYFLAAMAEANRGPFDLMEADSELVAGFHTEYSGMKFAMFYLGEYAHTLGVAAIGATLFLGGWAGPVLPPILWLVIKVLVLFLVIMWVRATLPRLRVDQLMAFAWKFLLPLALVNIFLVAVEMSTKSLSTLWVMMVVNTVAGVLLVYLLSRLWRLGGGKVAV